MQLAKYSILKKIYRYHHGCLNASDLIHVGSVDKSDANCYLSARW